MIKNSTFFLPLLLLVLVAFAFNPAFADDTDVVIEEIVLDEIIIDTGFGTDDYPNVITVNPDTNMIYVANLGTSTVSVIDGDTNTVIGDPIFVRALPFGIVVNPIIDIIYVANYGDDAISVIDVDNGYDVFNILTAGIAPHSIAINPDNNLIYVTIQNDNHVFVYDGTANQLIHGVTYEEIDGERVGTIMGGGPIDTGDQPSGIARNPNNNMIYVANEGGANAIGSVSVIDGDTNTVIGDLITVGNEPKSITVNPNDNMVYVANYASNTVSVINGNDLDAPVVTIQVGNQPAGIAVNPITNLIYVTNEGDGTVSIIDGLTNKVIGDPIQVGNQPAGIAVNTDPDNNVIYVANSFSNTVSVINGTYIPITILDPVDDTEPKKSGGSCADCTPPTFGKDKNYKMIVSDGFTYNGMSANVTDYHTEFPLITVITNATNTVTVKVYENQGVNNIKMVQFGLGMPEVGSPLDYAQSLVEVSLSGIEIKEVNTIDPNNLVDIINATTSVVDCNGDSNTSCLEVTLEYVYRDQPKYNIMAINAVDNSRNSKTNYLNDGILVVGESLNEPLHLTTTTGNSNAFYPQRAGSVLLTLVDYKTDMWKDEYGYTWSTDKFGPYMIDYPSVPLKSTGAYSEWSGYNDRTHSEFAAYVIQQQERAQETMDKQYYKSPQKTAINDIIINTDNLREIPYGLDELYTECNLLKNEFSAQVWLSLEYPYIAKDKSTPLFSGYIFDSFPLVSLSAEIVACDAKIQTLIN